MTQAIRELTKVRQRLHDQLHELQVEVDAIEKAINVLDREDQNDGSASTNKEFAKTGLRMDVVLLSVLNSLLHWRYGID